MAAPLESQGSRLTDPRGAICWSHRPGNHQHAVHRVRRQRVGRSHATSSSTPRFCRSPVGWSTIRLRSSARTSDVITEALGRGGLAGRDLAAIGVTNQRETTVVWNPKTGQPWYNAIVWQDTRTEAIVREVEGKRAMLRERTGLPPATYFSASKLRWILDNVDGVRKAVDRGEAVFGTIDTWVIWNLTGGVDGGAHVTDVTNASRTLLMDLRRLDWDDELLALFDIPRRMLPKICSSSDRASYGATRRAGPAGAEVALAGDLGDQQAAMVGQACFSPGEAKNTYGTGNFMLLNTGAQIVLSQAGLLTTPCYRFGDAAAVYALEGSIAVTGSAVQWLRDQLGIIATARSGRPRGERARCGRDLFRPRILRLVRAVLAGRRAGRNCRTVALPHQSSSGACHARGDLFSDQGRPRRDDG